MLKRGLFVLLMIFLVSLVYAENSTQTVQYPSYINQSNLNFNNYSFDTGYTQAQLREMFAENPSMALDIIKFTTGKPVYNGITVDAFWDSENDILALKGYHGTLVVDFGRDVLDNFFTFFSNDGYNVEGVEIEGQSNTYLNGDDVYIANASRMKFDFAEVIGVKNSRINKFRPDFNIGSAQKIITENYDIINGTNISQVNESYVKIGKADKLIIYDDDSDENITMEYVKDSHLVFGDDGLEYTSVFSDIDNNSFEIHNSTITADEDMGFEFTLDGNKSVFRTNSTINISYGNESVITLTNDIDSDDFTSINSIEKQTGQSYVETIKGYGISKVVLAPTSRYISHGDSINNKPFSFYAVAGKQLELELVKNNIYQPTLNLNLCEQCVVINYPQDSMMAKGIFELERQHLTLPIFVDIVESLSPKNKMMFYFDNNLDKITKLDYMEMDEARIFSGQFEIYLNDGEIYYRFMKSKGTPYTIQRIVPNIEIDESGWLKRFEDVNTFTMYARETTANQEFLNKYDSWLLMTDDSGSMNYDDKIDPKELWVIGDHVSHLFDGPFRYAFFVNYERN